MTYVISMLTKEDKFPKPVHIASSKEEAMAMVGVRVALLAAKAQGLDHSRMYRWAEAHAVEFEADLDMLNIGTESSVGGYGVTRFYVMGVE